MIKTNMRDFIKIIKIPATTINLSVEDEDRENIVTEIQKTVGPLVAQVFNERNGTKLICTNKTVVYLHDKISLGKKVRQFEELRAPKES